MIISVFRPRGLLPVLCLLPVFAVLSCAKLRTSAMTKLHGKDKSEAVAKKDPTEAAESDKKADLASDAPASSVDLSFLLTMNYAEAKSISAQSMELPWGVRVAADSIEVLKLDRDNAPKKIRAKGKVYLESGDGDMAKVLCQEALITMDELILRGKPILQRGGSIVEGLDDGSMAFMMGSRLRVLGLHRVTNQDTMVAMMPDLGPWAAGPNPLLPALEENAVPSNIREEMLKAAEAEAVLQQNRTEALAQPDAAPAPWVKSSASGNNKTPSLEKPKSPDATVPPVKTKPKPTSGTAPKVG